MIDYTHLAAQVIIIAVSPVMAILFVITAKRGEGWLALLGIDLMLAAVTAIDENGLPALAFVLLFLWHLKRAIKDWDRPKPYEPGWLSATPNREKTMMQMGRPCIPIAASPYQGPGQHRPEVIATTGEIPVFASQFKL